MRCNQVKSNTIFFLHLKYVNVHILVIYIYIGQNSWYFKSLTDLDTKSLGILFDIISRFMFLFSASDHNFTVI